MKIKIISIFILSLFLFSACGDKDAEHDLSHGDEGPEPLAYTLYSDKLEIFVEFMPLVVGENTKFAAHFTVLGESFTALTEGTVSVSLIVGDKGIKNIATEASSPGIYRLALNPTTSGKGKLIFDISTKDFKDQFVINDVMVYVDEKTAIAEAHSHEGTGDISYLKEQAWKVEFANIYMKPQQFHDVIKASGVLSSAPGDETLITAKTSGIVSLNGNKTIVGSEVKSGSTLFTISGGNFADGNVDSRYKEAKTEFDKAKLDLDRGKELIKDKIISEKEFQERKAKFQNAETAYNALSKNYSGKGIAINSDMNGYIRSLMVSEGQYVSAGTPLASVSANKTLTLQVNVSQKYFNKLSSIKSANFKTGDSEKTFSTTELNAKLISYGKSANINSHFIPVIFEFNNTVGLIPGSIVEVFLNSDEIKDALIVPVSALIEEQGHFYVYVQKSGESFDKREVMIGGSDGKNVQILQGIKEGERVVSKGAYQIKLATASGTLPAHGHEH